ncbi:hypothetical protein N7486_002109 [Penicillium sp. IBT 16267x]|nr:hypothetical protein N7486_002109 [Penicillium sp. IBT 16267x]
MAIPSHANIERLLQNYVEKLVESKRDKGELQDFGVTPEQPTQEREFIIVTLQEALSVNNMSKYAGQLAPVEHLPSSLHLVQRTSTENLAFSAQYQSEEVLDSGVMPEEILQIDSRPITPAVQGKKPGLLKRMKFKMSGTKLSFSR